MPCCTIPLEAIIDAATTEVNPTGVCEVAKQMAVSVQEEISKNEIVRQIVSRKIGDNFLVTKKPITHCGGITLAHTAGHIMMCVSSTKLNILETG